MEELWIKIKRNLARSYKSIRFNWKQYVSFFAAIFLMQSFFWLLMLTLDAQTAQLRKNAEENYDYHISVGNLTQDEAIRLQNGSFAVFLSDKTYEILRVNERQDAYGHITYTLYIELMGDEPEQNLRLFERKYLNPIVNASARASAIIVDYSPLITLTEDIAALRPTYYSILAVFTLVSVLVLMLLYNIRINHFKFMYGIYMAFGADYKKLLYTAAWELITVSLMTLAPALVFAALIRLALSLTLGGSFSVSLVSIPIVFLLNLAVIFAAVALPMRWVSARRPVALLSAEDNANLVSSLRRSFDLFGKRFPRHYVQTSIWRYRTYYLRLLLSSVIFAALSISVLYIGSMYTDNRDAPTVPYTITAQDNEEGIDPLFADAIADIEGVERIEYTYNLEGLPAYSDHLLMPSNRVKTNAFPYYVVSRVQGLRAEPVVLEGFRAINHAAYFPINENTIASLEQQDAADENMTIEGDLRSVLTTPGTVVVSDSIYNSTCFTLKPGDKIQLAQYVKYARAIDQTSSEKNLLRQQLLRYVFDYVELTVGAVIHGMPTDRNIMLGLSDADCVSILGISPVITELSVVTDPALSEAEQEALRANIDDFMYVYSDYVLREAGVYEDAEITHRMGIEQLLTIVAAMILIFFPLVCFFSQLLFYFKRNKEFAILLALGAVDAEICRAHRIEGIMLSLLNFILTLGMSFSLNWIVFSAVNTWLPSYGILETTVRYQYGISPLMLVICLVISLLCGFLSCEIPYHQFISRQKKLAAAADALDDAH